MQNKGIKIIQLMPLMVFAFIMLFSLDASAAAETGGSSGALFTHLAQKASEVFMGMREIIYVVSAFGILGVAIGGFFGNINWKWFGAIAIGLMVIALTSSLIKYLIGSDSMTYVEITDSMIAEE